jgi:hypothetical protein
MVYRLDPGDRARIYHIVMKQGQGANGGNEVLKTTEKGIELGKGKHGP